MLHVRTGRVPAFVLAAVLGGWPGAAGAAACLDAVERLAADYRLSIDPTDAPPPSGPDLPGLERLGPADGIIEPPATGDPAVIEPPEGLRYGMETLPDVPPDRPAPARPESLSPPDSVILQSILVAARAEAMRGSEQDCLEQLRRAGEFIEEHTPASAP